MKVYKLINDFLSNKFNQVVLHHKIDDTDGFELFHLTYNDLTLFYKDDHGDFYNEIQKNINDFINKKSIELENILLEIKTNIALFVKETSYDSVKVYINIYIELENKISTGKDYLRKYFDSELERIRKSPDYKIRRDISGIPEEKFLSKMKESKVERLLLKLYGFHKDVIKEIVGTLQSSLEQVIEEQRKPLYELTLSQRMIILGMLSNRGSFPKYQGRNFFSKNDYTTFVAYILNEKISSVDTAYDQAERFVNTEKSRITDGQIRQRRPQLQNIIKCTEIYHDPKFNEEKERLKALYLD